MFRTPILIINFNRPDFTRKVMEAVMNLPPSELFVFQDGPRKGKDDKPLLEEVRVIIKEMTDGTDTHVHTNYSSTNLGCGPGPATALTWFFSNVEEGIILEDDAIPHPDFFEYAAELLEKYRNNPSVKAIGSMNVDKQKWGDGSYYFSMMNRNLCSWATWKRAWQSFDIRLKRTSRFDLAHALQKYGCSILEREYWCDRLDEVHKDGVGNSSWDMQFFMSVWLQHGKGIIPNVNLSSNIGTVTNATHPLGKGNIIENIPTNPILPLKHPSSEEIMSEADRQFHFMYFEPNHKNWTRGRVFRYLVNKRIKKTNGHKGPWRKKR